MFLRRNNRLKDNKSGNVIFIPLDPYNDAFSISLPDSRHAVSQQASILELWLPKSYSRNIMSDRMDLSMTWLQMDCRNSCDN